MPLFMMTLYILIFLVDIRYFSLLKAKYSIFSKSLVEMFMFINGNGWLNCMGGPQLAAGE